MNNLSCKELIFLNQYAQEIIERTQVEAWFDSHEECIQKIIVREVWVLACQAQAAEKDLKKAATAANLKVTNTCVVMLNKSSVPYRNRGFILQKLKGKELKQAFILVLECFSLASKNKRQKCNATTCNHWWHENLADPDIIKSILSHDCRNSR